MSLHLAQFTLTTRRYMADQDEPPQRLTRLVEAESEQQAKIKLENAYPTEPYVIYRRVEDVSISEVIR